MAKHLRAVAVKDKQVEIIGLPCAIDIRIFVCCDHDRLEGGPKPASIVFARSEEKARELLDQALRNNGLRPYSQYRYRFREITPNEAALEFAEVLTLG